MKTIMAFLCCCCVVGLSFGSADAFAQYPSAKRNSDLLDVVKNDPNRVIRSTEHFSFAIDGDAFWRVDNAEEFYHGFGYWLQARSEARLQDFLTANLRSIFYSGNYNLGYTTPSANYHLFGLTARFPGTFLGGKLLARVGDLERQTVGAGLMVQEEEFNGGLLRYEIGDHSLLLRGDGTGVLVQNDDFYNAELSFWNRFFGFGIGYWPFGREQSFLPAMREPLYYVFSANQFSWFDYALELGTRHNTLGALAKLGVEWQSGDFRVATRLEARRYADRFAQDFAGSVQQLYTSYDQYDKAFTSPTNIFVTDDDVTVGAVHLNLWWRLSQAWRLHSLNEVGRFDYETATELGYYFFRQGIEHCPIAGRDDCINFFFSNKVLMNSDSTPPSKVAITNERLFKTVPFIGFEGKFRF